MRVAVASTNYMITTNDTVIGITSLGGATRTITLPSAATVTQVGAFLLKMNQANVQELLVLQ